MGLEGKNHLVLCRDPAVAQPWLCALETHAFPTSALPGYGLTFRRTGLSAYQLDARAAGEAKSLCRFSEWAEAEATSGAIQPREVGNWGAWVLAGIGSQT